MKPFLFMILVLTLYSSGCQEKTVDAPPMRYSGAVVQVDAGDSSFSSPVSESYGVSPNGERTGYGARHAIEDRIDVKYEYIGRGECAIADTSPREWTDGDVYLFTIMRGPETSVVPIVFTGDTVKVYENDEFTVTINPANNDIKRTGQAASAVGAITRFR